jgi:inorganic triphosphatase YgiF
VKDTREKELKLLSAPRARARFFSLPLIKDKILAGSRKTLHLENAYYDTPDQAFARAGLAYRVRCTNAKVFECTVKTRGKAVGGFTDRGEYTQALPSAEPVFEGFGAEIDAALKALTASGAPTPFCKVAFTRKIALLQISHQTVVEAAIDDGTISAGNREETIGELELELKKGSERDLMRFTAQLAQEIPLYPEKRSKLKRALDLMSRVPLPDKTVFSSVPGDEDAFTAWRLITESRLDRTLAALTACWQHSSAAVTDVYEAFREVAALWEWGTSVLSQRAYAEGKALLTDALQGLAALSHPQDGARYMKKLGRTYTVRALEEAWKREALSAEKDWQRALSKGTLAAAVWKLWQLSESRKARLDSTLTAEWLCAETMPLAAGVAPGVAASVPRISSLRLLGQILFMGQLSKNLDERFCRRGRKYLKEISRWERIQQLRDTALDISRREKGRNAGTQALVFFGYVIPYAEDARNKANKQSEKLESLCKKAAKNTAKEK